MNQLTVRKILPDDWQACWDIQRSLHTEMEEHLWSADLWVFICGTLTDSFVVCDENDTPIGYWIGVLQVNPNEETPDIWCLARHHMSGVSSFGFTCNTPIQYPMGVSFSSHTTNESVRVPQIKTQRSALQRCSSISVCKDLCMSQQACQSSGRIFLTVN